MSKPSYLTPADIKDGNVVIGAGQPEYTPLIARIEHDSDDIPMVVTEWSLTDEQRKLVAEGHNIFLGTMVVEDHPFVPVKLAVAAASPKKAPVEG